MYLKLILPFLLMVAETLRVTTNRGETEKITYLSLEHATILYVDPDYGKATQFSRQYSRSDPVHYLTVNFTSYFGFGNNYTIHYFFFEFLTNTYKRGFVEMHFGICDMVHKNKYFGISFMQGRLAGPCPYPPITYFSLEHATITYCDPKYGKAYQVARRYSRSDPVYYFSSNFTIYVWFGNNFTAHYFFYEFLTNTYKRGFIEFHFGICDLVHKNKYFGISYTQGRLAGPCPYPPGDYRLDNMTIPTTTTSILKGFPFKKGRIYLNITFGPLPTDKVVFSSYIDMELKQMTKMNRK